MLDQSLDFKASILLEILSQNHSQTPKLFLNGVKKLLMVSSVEYAITNLELKPISEVVSNQSNLDRGELQLVEVNNVGLEQRYQTL